MTDVEPSKDKNGIFITTLHLLKLAFPLFLSSASWVSLVFYFEGRVLEELGYSNLVCLERLKAFRLRI